MGKTHYYFCWFNNTIPEQVGKLLSGDLPNRQSLVSIATTPSDYEGNDEFVGGILAKWFNPIGITFNEYHLIDYRIAKERAHELLKNASAILLHGGDSFSLKEFMKEYEMSAAITESNADVIMGASAGMMSMSAHWIYNKRMGKSYSHKYGDKFTVGTIYDGLGLDNFAVEVTKDTNDVEAAQLDDEILQLSRKIDVYVACNESTIRSKNGKLNFFGKVYLVSDGKMQKIKESF